MSTTNAFIRGAAIYRDSPNTFGHENTQAQRDLLKKILGLVASQVHLQDSISEHRSEGYYDGSKGLDFLWDRLKNVEDDILKLEEHYGETIKSREFTSHSRGQSLPEVS